MEEEILTNYFDLGLSYAEICAHLRESHNIVMSVRTLKRRLRFLNLHRRKNYADANEVASFLTNEVHASRSMHGYKWMHLKCLQNKLIVPRSAVHMALQIIDPEGVEARRRKRLRRRLYMNKGPNYVWHVDGYDKLKPFGICIHGCIDGFSRYIIWVKAGSTNNDPRIIAGKNVEMYQLDQ